MSRSALPGTTMLFVLGLTAAAGHAGRDWSVASERFIDAAGRERFFHGVNLVYKSAPYVPRTDADGPLSFTDRDAAFLEKIGMNAVRLGVMWGGVEPVEGQYNETYMAELKKIVRVCEAHGIAVLLDFHQDGLSEPFCGEGIPWWAAHNYGPAYRAFPGPIAPPFEATSRDNFAGSYAGAKIPKLADCNPLARNYNDWMASYASARNYEDLYTNGQGLRDKFAGFWRYVAEQFRSDSNVIGFELINEPAAIWPRNYTESQFLQPLYDVLATAIHDADPSRVLFFNPVTWDRGYAATDARADFNGFEHVPGGAGVDESRSVYAFHYYDYGHLYNGEPYFASKLETARNLKTMGFVTEFDLEQVAQLGDEHERHFSYSMDLMDRNLQSWMAWTYKGFYPVPYLKEEDLPFAATCTGCGSGIYPDLPMSMRISWPTVRTMSRTYAQAVQGRTESVLFDTQTGAFTLIYNFDPSVQAPTLIYVNRELGGGIPSRYANGVDVILSDPRFGWTLNGTVLAVAPREPPPKGGARVAVKVAPAEASHAQYV